MPLSLSTSCTSALSALGVAKMMLATGMAPGVLVGCAEAANTPIVEAMLDSCRVLSQEQDDALPVKPFSPQRSGMILAEGAFAVVLAKEPVQRPLGFLRGVGFATERGTATGVSADGSALKTAIQRALVDADLSLEDIDAIIGHGSGTPKGDAAEYAAYQALFRGDMPPLVAHKWLLGHALAASPGMSLVLALDHMEQQELPRLPYDCPWAGGGRVPQQLEHCLVTSLGFGGYAAAVIISRS